ncbi:hypothetical protein ABTH20_19780, partial [Acinetobacter baumannii]
IARSLRGQARHESGTSEQARSAKSAAIKDLRGQLERTKNAGYIPVEDGYSNGSKVVPIVLNLPAKGSQPHRDMVAYQAALAQAGVIDYSD